MSEIDFLAVLIFGLFAFALGVSMATRMAMKFLNKAWDEAQDLRDQLKDSKAKVIYVSTAGDDTKDGKSWKNSKRTIEGALKEIESNDH